MGILCFSCGMCCLPAIRRSNYTTFIVHTGRRGMRGLFTLVRCGRGGGHGGLVYTHTCCVCCLSKGWKAKHIFKFFFSFIFKQEGGVEGGGGSIRLFIRASVEVKRTRRFSFHP